MDIILINLEKTFDELFELESVIKLTKESCLDREIEGKYYSMEYEARTNLSEERNHYNNLLGIALDKIANLKEINLTTEIEISKLKQYSDYGSRKVTA